MYIFIYIDADEGPSPLGSLPFFPEEPPAPAPPRPPGLIDADIMRRGIEASRCLAAIELSVPDWSITRLNAGAHAFFGSLPWMTFTGVMLSAV